MFEKLFRRNEISLNRIHHTVTVNENGEKLKLTISADPMRLVAGLTKAQKKLTDTINGEKEPTEEEIKDAAEYFAAVLFGREQTEKLFEFYAGDAACVINVCGQIFKDQLARKISKAQKKMKV
jgi:hypothetical protein